MFKILIISLVICLAVPFAKTQAGQAEFFESLYDVPVMAGLHEEKDMSVSFDKAQGRIAYAYATAPNIRFEDVIIFYDKALGQMGWQKLGSKAYVREQEKLEISLEKTSTSEVIRFVLQPLGH